MEPQTIDTENPQKESDHDQSISDCPIVYDDDGLLSNSLEDPELSDGTHGNADIDDDGLLSNSLKDPELPTFGSSGNSSEMPLPHSAKPPQLSNIGNSESLQVHLDAGYTLHGMSSFVSLPTAPDKTLSTVTVTHISQPSHDNADIDDISMSEESDSVPSEEMQNVSQLALQKVGTNYHLDMQKSTLRVLSEEDDPNTIQNTVQLTGIGVQKLRSNSIEAGISDSDDYQIAPQQTIIDNDINEKCNEIRRGFRNNYIQFKWQKLMRNHLFYARFPTCILALFLLFLSVTYCIGQTCETQLDLITHCEPKTREDIWQHSAEVQLTNHKNKTDIARESQYGWNDDACWSTKSSEINEHTLWSTTKYTYDWVDNPMNIKTVLFGLISLYCLIVILYMIVATVNDIIDIANNTLHQRALFYLYQQPGTSKVKKESIWLNYFVAFKGFYKANFSTDAFGWIVIMFSTEVIEIIVQYNALWLYNGYNVFDPNNERNVYLANKPEFIVIFAAIFGDTYTQPVEEKLVWIAQLNISSNLAFTAAFMPLFFLVNKCLFITINLVHKMRNEYFNQWQFVQTILSHTNTKLLTYQAQLRGFKNQNSIKMQMNQKELFDHKGNIHLNVRSVTKHNATAHKKHFKVACVAIMALLYFVFGIQVLTYTTTYLNEAEQYCYQIDENRYFDAGGTYTYHNKTLSDEEKDLLTRHSQLFLWHKCLYRVYPFAGDEEDYKCQCRVFVLDWETDLISNADDRHTYLNITQSQMLTAVMQQYYMLEKFSTKNAEGSISTAVHFQPDMFRARMLRAFSWISLTITGIDANASVRLWSYLEYFRIENTNSIRELPSDFDELRSLEYFQSTFGGLTEFPPQLCSLPNLKVIQIEWSIIETVPHCIANALALEQLHINGGTALAQFSLSLLTLPHLQDVSLWKAPFLTFENVLAFNNITNTSKASLDQYFDAHFAWNDNTNYYFSLTPLCENEYPAKLQEFLNKKIDNNGSTCSYLCDLGDYYQIDFCPPYVLGDGKCDFGCNSHTCLYDGGDCNQLCFSSEFSNCTMELFSNNVCDEECNNIYCQWSHFGTTSFDQATSYADRYCIADKDGLSMAGQLARDQAQWAATCYSSLPQNIYTTDYLCLLGYAGDGFCDDACRTDGCGNDMGDCDNGCIDDGCNLMLNAWTVITEGRNDVYLLTEQDICDFWPTAKIIFKIGDFLNCIDVTKTADMNNDQHINFKEFQIAANMIVANFDDERNDAAVIKGQQLNCSACVGMEHFNDIYTPM